MAGILLPKMSTQTWLESFLRDHGAVAGTVHTLRADDGDPVLELEAAVNIPPKVQEITATIPRGKGMAGLAWERHEPVTTCNLKDDKTGDVRPGAKAVDAQGAVALPVDDEAGNVRAVVGIAYAEQRDLTRTELDDLAAKAKTVP